MKGNQLFYYSFTSLSLLHFVQSANVGSHHVLSLDGRGYVIIATPYASGFDHLRIADEAQFKFDRCLRALLDDYKYRPLVQ